MSEEAPEETPEGPTGETVFPEKLDYTTLPDQTMYKVDMWNTTYQEFFISDFIQHPLIMTNNFRVNMTRAPAGAKLDWHTHHPQMEQVNLGLKGTLKITMEKENGDLQVIFLEEGELAYLPGGARNKFEVVGDEENATLNIFQPYDFTRLESLKGGDLTPYPTIGELPVALWVDNHRMELVEKDDDSVSEGEIIERDRDE